MKTKLIFSGLFIMLFFITFVSAIEPMQLRTIESIESVDPSDIANLGFGVYEVSAQYNLGSYHDGEFLSEENKKCADLKYGPVWIEVSWERSETDIVIVDGAGNKRKIYLPASPGPNEEGYGDYYWIAEDGSSYYAYSGHDSGWADMDYEEALSPKHLARASESPSQKNFEEEPLDCGLGTGDSILIKGKLIDQLTNEPISYAELHSAYEFSPGDVKTDAEGNFEFTVSSKFSGSYSFYAECYGWAGNIGTQENYERWEDGKIQEALDLALIVEKFDSKPLVFDIEGKKTIDIGYAYAYPKTDLSTQTDKDLSLNVQYKYKNSDGYNGQGNSNYKSSHYLSDALPLGYEVFIQFEDEAGNQYDSSRTLVPKDKKCSVINLDYHDGESDWTLVSGVEPTEDSGPIKVKVPDVIQEQDPGKAYELCSGCLKGETCYPLGYRKSGDYCSDSKEFISQVPGDEVCENNFECTSNVCVSGKCVSESLIDKIFNWFSRLL